MQYIRPSAVQRDPAAMSVEKYLSGSKDLASATDKNRGKRLMRQEYKIGKAGPKYVPTEDRQAFRERILSFSLFPNIFNQKTIMTSLGAS